MPSGSVSTCLPPLPWNNLPVSRERDLSAAGSPGRDCDWVDWSSKRLAAGVCLRLCQAAVPQCLGSATHTRHLAYGNTRLGPITWCHSSSVREPWDGIRINFPHRHQCHGVRNDHSRNDRIDAATVSPQLRSRSDITAWKRKSSRFSASVIMWHTYNVWCSWVLRTNI